ncbi:MAG: ferritin-like domain-containing protein, partial [Polyangiaceae bacterium]
LKARFLLAMGPFLVPVIGTVACHSGASPDPSAQPTPTSTTNIPSSSSTAASDTPSALPVASDTPPPPQLRDAGPIGHPPGMRPVTLPDGGVVYERMPFLGRPLRVQDEARVAPSASRADWILPLEMAIATMPADERATLADVWKRDAASEHASIASFSRFSLQLLALGAPADLVEAAHDAALDEARHARDAYALASAYAGEAVGPGPLDVRGALEHIADVTLAKLAIETFEDGCIGETIAAWDAREKAASCTDSIVHEILARVADDEERHAALAWQAVAWAVKTGGDDVRVALKAAIARAATNEALSRHGLFSTVIAPCFDALIAS